jgi:molecular chaperone HscB
MTNYFEFYGLDERFFLDASGLKQVFYEKSRQLHPDFHTMSDPAEQMEKLQLSSVNNQAYKVLSDPDLRMAHILEIHGMKDEVGQASVPQEFLMEMMELNETLMDWEMDPDEEKKAAGMRVLKDWYEKLAAEAEPAMRAWDSGDRDAQKLEIVKAYWLKKKYLRRIETRLNDDVEL